MGFENLRKQCETLYYSGDLQPQNIADISDFVRRVGVHPSASAIEAHRKKAHRRLGVNGSGAIIPFADVVGFVLACYVEASKVDPSAAEDQDYLAEVWTHCGGDGRSDEGVGSIPPTAAVPTNAIARALEDVGLSSEPVENQRRHALHAASQRSRASVMPVDHDSMTYKDFVELVNAPADTHDVRAADTTEATKSSGGTADADMYRTSDTQEAGYRPRLSFVMMMRIRQVIRAFKRRREARLEKERRDRELDAYARRYFGTDIFSPDGPSAARRRPSVSEQQKQQQQQPSDPAAASRRPSASHAASASQRPAAGNAVQAARARRNANNANGGHAHLPPLVDERQSAFDRALAEQEAAERRHQREMRQQRLQTLQKSHPRKDGCIDVVRRYASSPVPVKAKNDDFSETRNRCATMGRPRPQALSPTQLRQKATPVAPRRAASRTGGTAGTRTASRNSNGRQ